MFEDEPPQEPHLSDADDDKDKSDCDVGIASTVDEGNEAELRGKVANRSTNLGGFDEDGMTLVRSVTRKLTPSQSIFYRKRTWEERW